MTIFSVLKYQLSDPPTFEEFSYLPWAVIWRTSKKVGFNTDPETLCGIIRVHWGNGHNTTYDYYMSILRQEIFEYEDEV